MKKLSVLLIGVLFLPIAVQAETIESGDLITCLETDAVYYYGEDGQRYVFQNEKSFFSWEEDFSRVKTMDCDDLSTIPLAGIVPYQSGIRLVKMPSVPTVYVIEPNGVLREIPDEDTAADLYGENWSDLVDDLDESFFPQYEVGEPIEEDELPEGMILTDGAGTYYRVYEDGSAVEVDVTSEDIHRSLDDVAIDISLLKEEAMQYVDYVEEEDVDYEALFEMLMEAHGYVDIDDEKHGEAQVFEELSDEEIEAFMLMDSDGDGLPDVEEEDVWKTDPGNPDTDGDGYLDGDEVAAGYDPLGDGMLVVEEYDEMEHEEVEKDEHDMDGDVDKDMEGDGTDDGEMEHDGYYEEIDSDGDGLWDEEEMDYGTDPYFADSDGDGVDDGQEVLDGTDPMDADDVLTDMSEYQDEEKDSDMEDNDTTGEEKDDEQDEDMEEGKDEEYDDNNPDGATGGSGPVDDSLTLDEYDEGDTDGDGLYADEEAYWGTDPYTADSDGDGVDDGQEVLDGTDPADADSYLMDESNATGDVTFA